MPDPSERTAHGDAGWLATLDAELDRRFATVEALRLADRELALERDRRYTEIGVEREKALRAKDKADGEALKLARKIQSYKDKKANDLRAQIESERGGYLTRREYEDKHQVVVDGIGRLRDDLATLRTDVAVGPRELPQLRSRLDLSAGERAGLVGHQATMMTWLAFLVSVGVMIGVIVQSL